MTTTTRTPRAPSAWRRWRTARPFWGGLLVTLSGAEILLAVKAPLPVVLHVGMQGLAGYLVPIVLLICGVLLLVSPAQRVFYSTIAAICALASWVTSNLGGFVVGMLLGLVGSALAFAWTADRGPRKTRAARAEPDDTEHDPKNEGRHSHDASAHAADDAPYEVPPAAGPEATDHSAPETAPDHEAAPGSGPPTR